MASTGLAIFDFLVTVTPIAFSLFSITELLGFNLGYSKFAHGTSMVTVPSKVGMLILYAPSAALAAGVLFTAEPAAPRTLKVVAVMLCLHFVKRCLEVLFLHRFSGGTRLLDASVIAVGYSVITIGSLLFTGWRVPANELGGVFATKLFLSEALAPPGRALGWTLFVVGEVGNFYHHWLLAQLRTDPGAEKRYFVPRGGLFSLLTCPHYFCEVIAFLGVAFAAQTVYSLLIALSMFAYLSGRAYCTREWYRKKVPDFPKDRKLILPHLL